MITKKLVLEIIEWQYYLAAMATRKNHFLSSPIACATVNRCMSSYSEGRQVEYTDKSKAGIVLLDGIQQSPDLLLSQKAEQLCKIEGINYKGLEPIQRLFLTHYRCPICKLLPLYHLNLAHPKRVRCSKCGNLISFKNAGKYGRLRKKIAFTLWLSEEGGKKSVP